MSAGLHPPPGAHARAPAWRGRAHWLATVAAACERHPDLLRKHHVSDGLVKTVADRMARYADGRTGRDCRPTNERLMADAQTSWSSIKRARGFLYDVGLVVELVRGRSIMSKQERLEAWRNGSSHRQIASEFALTLPRRWARVVHNPGPRPVERGLPPRVSEGELVKSPDLGFFASGKPDRRTGAARRAHPQRRPPTRTPARARADRLIAGVQAATPWLSGVSPRRLSILHRFAAQNWTQRDVRQALDAVLKARGWTVPAQVQQPAAYLAALLRDVDPGDRPGALEEAMLAEERVRREWIWQTRFGSSECVHGQLAGDLPHPIDGHVVCPFCRRSRDGLAATLVGPDHAAGDQPDD